VRKTGHVTKNFQKSTTTPQLVQQIYGKSTTNLRLIAQMEFQ